MGGKSGCLTRIIILTIVIAVVGSYLDDDDESFEATENEKTEVAETLYQETSEDLSENKKVNNITPGQNQKSYEVVIDAVDQKSAEPVAVVAVVQESSEQIVTETVDEVETVGESVLSKEILFSLSDIPAYSGEAYVIVNENVPFFTEDDFVETSYENYSDLDSLGRCGVAIACVGQDIMPTEERGEIGQIKPSGWHTVKYDFVDGKYLYNRCHLIAYQLAGENSNTKNLITGTRYLNIEGMLFFENMVADYIQETNNHVLYRVTPVYEEDNLLATGVLMEAESVEDKGESILYCVFCYNVQPGVTIDYATGESCVYEEADILEEVLVTPEVVDYSQYTYVLNTNTKKVHFPYCSSVSIMNEENKQGSNASVDELISQGYEPCGNCRPFVIPTTDPSTTTISSDTTSITNTTNSQTVYVSNSGKIHSKSNCSGMKNYTTMTYDEAVAAGYTLCKKCY